MSIRANVSKANGSCIFFKLKYSNLFGGRDNINVTLAKVNLRLSK